MFSEVPPLYVLSGRKREEAAGAAGEEKGAAATGRGGDELTEGGEGQPHQNDARPDPGKPGAAGCRGSVSTLVSLGYAAQ